MMVCYGLFSPNARRIKTGDRSGLDNKIHIGAQFELQDVFVLRGLFD